jgi:2,4-dienoyl-CoA reductase-like NADH-dependent reductase (Old Yellow Enzyme family)
VIGARPLGPSRTFSPRAQRFSRAAGEEDLARLEADFARAAALAVEAGFDGLEVHLGHGYLLSQFLCPWNNRRRDAYGGSLENRARFPRRVLRAVREAAAGRAAVWAKLNMEDGFAGGLTLDDGVEVARWIEQDGSVDALQLTGGHTTRSPFFLMRGDVPLAGMIENEHGFAAKLGMRFFGRLLIRPYRFEQAFFLPSARRFRERLRLPLMLLGGLTRFDAMEGALAEGFELVALGRALISDPDLPQRLRAGTRDAARCTPCNLCVVEMERGGTRCVLGPEGARGAAS